VSRAPSSPLMSRLWLSAVLLLAMPTLAALEQVPVTADGGVFSLPVQINGVLQMDLVLDTGAAYVMIPADVALTLKRTGTLNTGEADEIKEFALADGSVIKQRRVVLRSLQIGPARLCEVQAIVGGLKSPLLLGQSALRRLEPWQLDTRNGRLLLMRSDGHSSGRDAAESEDACQADDFAR
jgi:clan AA aspartic protease (TIGR02281 family)